MWKLTTIFDFNLKIIGCTMMIVASGYNIVLMWNDDFMFKTELIVLFAIMMVLCGWLLVISIKEFKEEKNDYDDRD